ncbi:MAG: AraC family transcriptional regulator ligand-binding domain-containing protein [Cytophagales bacterium]|nr:AraC family transcriptional regulator ligand-binding domain-containing protein [Cytophagales bacterium]
MNYISVNLYKKIIDHGINEGLAEADFKWLATPIDILSKIQAVPADQFFELHEWLDDRLGPGFSIRVGQAMKMDDYGVLGLSWRTCSKAGEIFERCERYFKLLSNTYVFQVQKEGELSHVHLNREAYRAGVARSNESTFSATVVVIRAITETNISPVSVSFKHRSPSNLKDYTAAFQCPVNFDQSVNTITYKTADLETRTAKADFSINQFLVARVEEETNGIEISPNQIATEVESLIQNALPSGIPSIKELGAHMGMSNRTLTRRLSEHGVTFRDLIQKTQERLSKELLKGADRTVAEIAFQTGFSEQSAFNRAFKRWTGVSPIEFRKKLA